MKNPFLIGDLVYLRPLDRADAPKLQQFINDPDVNRMLLAHRPYSLEFEQQFIEKHGSSTGDIVLGICLRADDRLIGATGLHGLSAKDRHAAFGVEIGEKDYWGKGYGTEVTRLMTGYAFDTLNLNRVWLLVYENNERGRRAYEKVGYRREGVLRQYTWREGRWWDAHLMAMLAEEWRARTRG